MIKLIARYHRMRIMQKFFLFFMLFWLIPTFFISYYTYQKLTANLIQSQLELAEQSFQQAKSFLNYRIDRINLASNVIALDSTVNTILTRDLQNTMVNQLVKDRAVLRTYLNQFQNRQGIFDNFFLYVPNYLVSDNEGFKLFNIENVIDTPWYKRTFKGWGWITCNPPQLMEDPDVISIIRPIRDLSNYNSKIGAVRIDIPVVDVEQMLDRIKINQECLTYLTTSDSMLAGVSSHDLVEEYRLTHDELLWALTQDDRFTMLEKRGKTLWVYARELVNVDLILVMVLSETGIARTINAVQFQYVLSIGLLALIVIAIFTFLINSITSRLRHLVHRMKLIQEGDLDAELQSKHDDEIGLLIHDFNFMIHRIRDLLDEQYQMGRELKANELKALQSQINPHFLYNTLEMIKWLGDEGSSEKIKQVVDSLALFYRLSLNRGRDLTTVSREVLLVENFLAIQSLRYQQSIKLVSDLKEIEEFYLPKITLQPLAENAVLHGILEKDIKNGTIRITGRLIKDNFLEIIVEDDGVGIKPKRLEQLKNSNKDLTDDSSYGIANIEKRLCLFFNIPKALFIESQWKQGTRITIRIPAIKNPDKGDLPPKSKLTIGT